MKRINRFGVLLAALAIALLTIAMYAAATQQALAGEKLPPGMSQGGATYPILGEDIQNAAVREILNRAIRERALQGIPAADISNTVVDAQSGYRTTLLKCGLLSLRFENYRYWWHAAHGNTQVTSITLDLKDGREYRFSDLFAPQSPYRKALTAIIRRQITERRITLLRPYEGVGPDEQYYLTETELVVYYQQYEYTPYSSGIPEFRIPLADLIELAALGGPIGRLLAQ